MTKILFTITNDITYDQRMDRICSSLISNGFEVTLVGRKHNQSLPLKKPYNTVRLNCWAKKGKFFYIEFNIRLFFYLLFKKYDILCANDLDTVLPDYWVSKIRNKKIVFDAHEYFTEMEEVVRRPKIQALWKKIEHITVPNIKKAYTVNHSLAEIFSKKFNAKYSIIQNAPLLLKHKSGESHEKKYLIYSGAVNEGRGLEEIIHAMCEIEIPLIICGEGNKFSELKNLVKELNLEHKIEFKGFIEPHKLKPLIDNAYIGFNLLTNNGKSYYYSLANKFFDYMHAEIPQITVNFPEYKHINEQFKIAELIDLEPKYIVESVNKILNSPTLYKQLVENCKKAKQNYNWQKEEIKLVEFYKQVESEEITK